MISFPISALSRHPRALHDLPTVSLSPIFALSFGHTIFICCSMLFAPPVTVVILASSTPPLLSSTPDNFYRTVCTFPSLDDSIGCQRGGHGSGADLEDGELLNGWFCDPSSTMSMSEVFAIDETLRRIYEQNRHNCVCGYRHEEPIQRLEIDNSAPQRELHSSSGICWFRFGFAVVPELNAGPDSASAEHCANNFEIGTQDNTSTAAEKNSTADESEQSQQFNKFLPAEEKGNLFDTFTAFADNYARVLRERWQLGECGEDILILIVQQSPQKLSTGAPQSPTLSRPTFGGLPMLFLSFGPLLAQRVHPDFGHALQHIVLEANSQLQRDARPLFRVLTELLLRMDAEVLGPLGKELSRGVPRHPSATHARHRHSSYAEVPMPMPRSHIPPWAWAVFGACGIAFALMALGLFLIRTRTRRSGSGVPAALGGGFKKQHHHQHSTCSMMASTGRRHWKESGQFGKDDQPSSTTYVNLVQLLMPHPKQSPVNMPQQV